MSKKTLFILIGLVVVLGVLAKFNSNETMTHSKAVVRTLLNFDPDSVKTVRISSEGKVVVLKNTGGNLWICPSKEGYEAKSAKIGELLLKLLGLSSSQPMTSNKENYGDLGITGKDAVSVSLCDGSEKELAGMDFGKKRNNEKNRYSESGRYVKPHSENMVYLVSDDIEVQADPLQWLNTAILNLEQNQIREIRLVKNNPQIVLVKKGDKDNNFTMKDLKAGDKEKPWAVNQISGAFASLNFNNLFPQEIEKKEKLVFTPLLELDTNEGLTFRFSGTPSQFYLKIAVDYKPGEKEDPSKIAKLTEDAKKLNEKYSKWIYQLESFEFTTFTKQYSDLIETPPLKQEGANQGQGPAIQKADPESPFPPLMVKNPEEDKQEEKKTELAGNQPKSK